MKRSETLLTLISIILTVVTLIFVDFSPIIKSLAAVTGANLKDVSQIYSWLDIFFRISVFLFIILLVAIIDAIFFGRRMLWYRREKYYTCDDVVEYLKDLRTEILTLTVFGYSLTFAESLRLYLESMCLTNLEVNVVLANPDYILNNCKENKSIDHRIHQIRGRIVEWMLLAKYGRIHNINIYHFDSVPHENGVIVNDDVIFFGRYPWKLENGKFLLIKNPVKERVMRRMNDKNDLMYKYILQIIKLRQNRPVNTQYEVLLP